MENYHLTKEDGQWTLKKEGSDQVLISSPTRDEALDHMRDYMSEREGSVKIHGTDGRIIDESTYPRSSDPRSSRG